MGLCVYFECENTACYNYEGRKALMCEYHKCDNMIIIKNKSVLMRSVTELHDSIYLMKNTPFTA